MINQIIESQKSYFDDLMSDTLKIVTGDTDYKKSELAINNIYKAMGEKKPKIFHFTSPFIAILASCLLRQKDTQLDNQLDNQLRNQLGNQLDTQLDTQLRNQLDNQLDTQLDNQLRNQLGNQLYTQLYTQLDNQLYTQLRNQLDTQLGTQLYTQLGTQLGTQLYTQLGTQLYNQLDNHYQVFWWSYWACLYNFGLYIGAKLDIDILQIFTEFTENIHTGLPYKRLFIYSEKPKCTFKGNVLHNEKDMAVKYADGWGWYVLNGIVMQPEYVLTPANKLQPNIVLKEQSVDVRRELIRKIGLKRMAESGKQIDEWGYYKLIDMRQVLMSESYEPYLLMLNPSVPDTWHLEGVAHECKTVEQALNYRKPEAMKKIPVSIDGEAWYQQGDVCIWNRKALTLQNLPIVLT